MDVNDVINLDERYEVHDVEDNPGTLNDDPNDGEMLEVVDDSFCSFTSHVEPVYCLDLFGDSGVVVSGSQDEKAYVWDSKSDTQLAVVEGHKDTVVSVSFHTCEPCLATADMLGLIQVFSTETNAKIWSYDCGSDLEVMFWHPKAKVVFAGLGCGDLYMLKVGTEELKCYAGGGNGVSTAKLTESGLDVIIGYNDSSIKCWNLKSCTVISSCKLSAATESPISKIDNSSNKDQYFACSTEAVCLVHLKTGKILAKFGQTETAGQVAQGASSQSEDRDDDEIETFALCPSNGNLLCLGRHGGALETWDISAKSLRNREVLEGAIVKIVLPRSAQETTCLVATSAGVVFCFDALTGSVLRSFRGHIGPIFDIVLASDKS